MPIPRLLLAASVAVAGLSGCATNQNTVTFPDVVYQCEDGRWFRAIMNPTTATIVLPDGRRFFLGGRLAGGTASYRSRDVQFYAGRRGAFLRTPVDRPFRDCWLAEV